VAKRHEHLSDVLSEFARTMVTDFPIQQILDHLARRTVDILPTRAGAVDVSGAVWAAAVSRLRYSLQGAGSSIVG
jgi:thiazole synthase ThiGH ThiG subunit